MLQHKKIFNPIYRATALAVACLFLVNNVAFALSPASKFDPIASVTWDKGKNTYTVTENKKESAGLRTAFAEDAAFLYLNILIGQFLGDARAVSNLGMSRSGLADRLEEFKKSIARDLPHMDFDRFRYDNMTLDGDTVCLPYIRKDSPLNSPITQILRYYLADAETVKSQQEVSGVPILGFADKLDRTHIASGVEGLDVILEDPLDETAASETGASGAKNIAASIPSTLSAAVIDTAAVKNTVDVTVNSMQILMEVIPLPIFYKDEKGIYRGCNEAFAQFLGLSKEKIIGRSVYDISPSELAQKYHQADIELAARQGKQVYASQVRAGDGSMRDVIFYKASYFISGINEAGIVGVITDVTEQKKAENELRKAKTDAEASNAFKSRFLANMSHEIRTPLNPIIGFLTMIIDRLREHGQLSPEVEKWVGIINVNAEYLLALINDILESSKIEAGQLQLVRKPVQINTLMKEAFDLFSHKASGKNIEYQLDDQLPSDITVLGDGMRIRQVVINLLSNAIKFTPASVVSGMNNRVTLSLNIVSTGSEENIVVSVKDTGRGISKDEIDNLFKEFSQTRSGQGQDRSEGTGLGLALSKKLAKAMDGDITVESAEGVGSTFTFVFPAHRVKSDAAPREDLLRGKVTVIPEDITFIIAEDELTNRMILKAQLKNNKPVAVEDGLQLLRELSQRLHEKKPLPSVILLDNQMPNLGGMELLKLLARPSERNDLINFLTDIKEEDRRFLRDIPERDYEFIRGIPIIMQTAGVMDSEKEACLDLGARGFLIKPINMQQLISLIAEVAQRPQSKESRVESAPETVQTIYTSSEGEERYRRLAEEMPVYIATYLPDGTMTYCNDAMAAMEGKKPADLIGTSVFAIMSPESFAESKKLMGSLTPEHATATHEIMERTRVGAVCWQQWTVRAFFDVFGRPLRYQAVGLDITARKKAEDKLRESQEKYRTLVQSALDGFWVVDMHGRLVDVNDAYCQMSGYSREELLAMKVSDLEVAEKGVDVAAHMRKIIEKGGDRFDTKHRRKDGSIMDTEVNVQYKFIEGGQFVAFFRDITERKQAETYREMGQEVLRILNEPGDSPDYIRRVLDVFKTWTGFDAVGIRMQKGEDFPYLTQQGFSNDFLLKENRLIGRAADGGMCRDNDGKPCLECTCGLVISGKTDPSNPLFTKGGSSWTNDSFPLLHIPPSLDPRLNPRNECIHQGYTSVALIPIRNTDRIIGLIQLNDRSKGRFSLAAIEILEGIASHIGEALMRKKSDEVLLESEERHVLTLAAVKDGLWDWNVPSGQAYFSPVYFEILGYKDSEFPSTYDSWRSLVHPDDIDRVERELQKSIAISTGFSIDLRMMKKDGEWLWVSTRGNTIEVDEDGKALRIVGTLSDITERKESEEKIDWFSSILSGTTDIASIKSLDPEPRVLMANEAFLKAAGKTLEEVIGRTDREIFSEHMDTATIDLFVQDDIKARSLKAGEAVLREESMIYPNGEKRWLLTRKYPIFDAVTGKLIATANISPDITEHKKADEELKKRHELLIQQERLAAVGTLVGDVTHELNNPLAIMEGLGELVGQELAEGNIMKAQKHIDDIMEHLRRSHKVVGDLLLSVRPRAAAASKTIFPISRAIQTAVDSYAVLIHSAQASVTIQVDDDFMVYGDEDRMVEIYMNLIKNALDAPKGVSDKRITILAQSISQRGRKMISIQVRDNGAGADQKNVPQWFQPYFTTKPRGVGTGLGLPLVKTYIEEMGGSIAVTTEVGKGTTFELLIAQVTGPEVESLSVKAGSANKPVKAAEIRQIHKMLVIDDEEDAGMLYKRALAGYVVVVAQNGKEALELLAQPEHRDEPFDLIFTDYTMPIMNGLEFIRAFREMEREGLLKKDKTPAVLVTGFEAGPEYDAAIEFIKLGALDRIERKILRSVPLQELVDEMKRLPLAAVDQVIFTGKTPSSVMIEKSDATVAEKGPTPSAEADFAAVSNKSRHDINNALTMIVGNAELLVIHDAPDDVINIHAIEALSDKIQALSEASRHMPQTPDNIIPKYEGMLAIAEAIGSRVKNLDSLSLDEDQAPFLKNLTSGQVYLTDLIKAFLVYARHPGTSMAVTKPNASAIQASQPAAVVSTAKTAEQSLLDRDRAVAQAFIDEALWRSREAKKLNQSIVIGLDDSWVPKFQRNAVQSILADIYRLSKREGLDNIIVIRGEGSELAGNISGKVAEEKKNGREVPLTNVIVLGSEVTIASGEFAPFRSTDTEDRAFLVGVDPQYIQKDEFYYIAILEMLTMAMKRAFNESIAADSPFVEVHKDGQYRRVLHFLPRAEPIDPNKLKEIYDSQKNVIQSA